MAIAVAVVRVWVIVRLMKIMDRGAVEGESAGRAIARAHELAVERAHTHKHTNTHAAHLGDAATCHAEQLVPQVGVAVVTPHGAGVGHDTLDLGAEGALRGRSQVSLGVGGAWGSGSVS